MTDASITSKATVKKIKKACRQCGKNRYLEKTECCNNWICEDKWDWDVGEGYGCYAYHRKNSWCYHHSYQFHQGKLEDCEECMELGLSEIHFEDMTCVSCGFKSFSTEDFAFQLNYEFYCNKDECQAKGNPNHVKNAKRKANRVVVKKVKKACRACGKTRRLTKTRCCDNWICDDNHKYIMFSYDLNSCYRNHHRYSSCSHHHIESHEGKWRDCEVCTNLMCGVVSDFDEVTCVSCGLKSETLENFAFQINNDFYCTKDECQAKSNKPPPSKRTKRKAEVEEVVSSDEVKKTNRVPLMGLNEDAGKNYML